MKELNRSPFEWKNLVGSCPLPEEGLPPPHPREGAPPEPGLDRAGGGGWFLGSREGTGGPSSPPFKSGWSYLFGFTAFPPGAPFPVP